MGMTIDDFETKALQVLLSQRFLDFPLFVEEKLSDYYISDIQGEMNLEDFIRQYAEVITEQFKADYENRLNADLKAILVDLQLEIEEMDSGCGWEGYRPTAQVIGLIQDKINALKENTDGTDHT